MKSRFTSIYQYLQTSYPYYYNHRPRLLLGLGIISVLSLVFLYLFEPFEVNVAEHKINSNAIIFLHSFFPLPIAYAYFSILNLQHTEEKHWTLGKEFFHLSGVLFCIGIGSFLLRDVVYTNPDNWSWRYFGEEIRNTFMVGVLLLLIVLPLNLERLIHKHATSLKKLPTTTPPQKSAATTPVVLLVQNSVANEHLELDISTFLFAKVESNYTEFHSYIDGSLQKNLLRITLKELEEQLQPFANIYKTHRSYLVNLYTITNISGNAQGYQLTLQHYPATVPVSRSKIKSFNEVYAHR